MGRKHPSHQLPQPLGSLTDSPKADRYRVRKLEAFSLPIVGDYGKPEAMSRTSSDKTLAATLRNRRPTGSYRDSNPGGGSHPLLIDRRVSGPFFPRSTALPVHEAL